MYFTGVNKISLLTGKLKSIVTFTTSAFPHF